jgi:hypothetical protein
MNEKAIIMKKELRAVANYRALIISKNFLSFVLLIIALYLGIRRFPMSPLYILLFLNFLPAIFRFAANDYGMKSDNQYIKDLIKDETFLLSSLKAKYRYSRLNYVTNSVSYLISLILIALWQYNYNNQYYLSDFLKQIPVTVLAAGLVIRLFGVLFYNRKLPYDVEHNRV